MTFIHFLQLQALQWPRWNRMANHHGSRRNHASPRWGGRVTPSYVSPPDGLLTTIDFLSLKKQPWAFSFLLFSIPPLLPGTVYFPVSLPATPPPPTPINLSLKKLPNTWSDLIENYTKYFFNVV